MVDDENYQSRLFHVGVRVPDLERSMTELGQALGVGWAAVMEREQSLWTPIEGSTAVPLRFTYSCEGPQHIELLQGPPGSPWYGDDLPGLHHVGIWSDDVPAEVERLVGAGWALELAARSPQEGYGAMAYVRSPSGFLLELVLSSARTRMERWWAGGAVL